MRLRWLDVSAAELVPLSGTTPGADTADIVNPKPTSWAVLDDGDND